MKPFNASGGDTVLDGFLTAARKGRPSPDVPPVSAFPPPLRHGPFTLIETEIGRFWAPTGDEVMRPYLERHSAWDEPVTRLLGQLLRPGARFLDVGASLGYMSVFASRHAPRVKIDSVEPHPDAVDLLRFNLWLNAVPAAVWPVALDSRRRSLVLEESANNFGDARPSAEPSLGVSRTSLVVPAMPADDVFPRRRFDVVKIDVQGWELDVVLGMQRIIANSPGIALVVEFWPSAVRDRGEEPLAVLDGYRTLGLDVIVSQGERLEPLDPKRVVEMCDSAGVNGQTNLLLVVG